MPPRVLLLCTPLDLTNVAVGAGETVTFHGQMPLRSLVIYGYFCGRWNSTETPSVLVLSLFVPISPGYGTFSWQKTRCGGNPQFFICSCSRSPLACLPSESQKQKEPSVVVRFISLRFANIFEKYILQSHGFHQARPYASTEDIVTKWVRMDTVTVEWSETAQRSSESSKGSVITGWTHWETRNYF